MTSDNSTFQGVYAASITPMNPDLSCNVNALYEHCKKLVDEGCQGVLLFGTTGEGTSFSFKEKKEILKEMIHLGFDPTKIIVVIGCSSVDEAVGLALLSLEYRCSSVLILPPFYYKNVQELGVIDFYKQVIDKVNNPDLKVFLYHIPQYSGVPLTLNIIQTLQNEFPDQVIGMKESEGNLPFTKEILANCPNFKVFVGNELQISEAVQSGASGTMCGMANAFPKLIKSVYEYGRDSSKPNVNGELHQLMLIIRKGPFIPSIKYLTGNLNFVRPPLRSLNEEEKKSLQLRN